MELVRAMVETTFVSVYLNDSALKLWLNDPLRHRDNAQRIYPRVIRSMSDLDLHQNATTMIHTRRKSKPPNRPLSSGTNRTHNVVVPFGKEERWWGVPRNRVETFLAGPPTEGLLLIPATAPFLVLELPTKTSHSDCH